MNQHVHAELVEYIEGRLDANRVRDIEAHVATCSECAEDLAWAREFREAVIAQGLRHLAPERVLQIADRRGDRLNENEQRHLDSCPECTKEVTWAREHARPEERRASILDRLFNLRWAAASSVAVAAAIALLFFLIPRGSAPDYAALARHDPLPVRMSRGDTEPGSFEESRLRGLESYANGDYAAAREAFQRATELKPDDAETALYLGSAERFLGNSEEAAAQLRRAANSRENPVIRDAALWEIANAFLAAGRPRDTETALRELIALDRAHRADAERLLDLMNAAPR